MGKCLLGGLLLAWTSLVHAQILESPADHHRAGNPTVIKRLSQPTYTPRNIGYWVGGGAFSRRKGDGPAVEEGTWGWDYQGLLPRRVDLGWWHGRRYQGGSGAYKTDGPHLPHLPEAGHGNEHGNGNGHSNGNGHTNGNGNGHE